MRSTLAEAFDRYVSWLVFSIFLMSINLLMEASTYLVEEPASSALWTWAQWPARGATITVAIAFLVWVRRWRKRTKSECRTFLDEYVTETAKRSAFIAFFATLCLVALLDGVTNHTQLPADFFIKLPGLSLTAVFSISFFVLNFRDATDSPDVESTP
jgi:hypothetical protein